MLIVLSARDSLSSYFPGARQFAAVGGALDAEGAPGAEAAGGVTGGDEGEGVPTVTITVFGPAADPSQLNTNGSAGTS